MSNNYGVCPVCDGTMRMPAGDWPQHWKKHTTGYDEATDTLNCNNCGAQTMYGQPTGQVLLRPDGTPCKHEYNAESVGRCLSRYTCKHCSHTYEIDSGV